MTTKLTFHIFFVFLFLTNTQIVGNEFDSTEDTDSSNATYYETIYALLDKHSPKYRLTFGETLAGKLQSLQQDQGTEVVEGQH